MISLLYIGVALLGLWFAFVIALMIYCELISDQRALAQMRAYKWTGVLHCLKVLGALKKFKHPIARRLSAYLYVLTGIRAIKYIRVTSKAGQAKVLQSIPDFVEVKKIPIENKVVAAELSQGFPNHLYQTFENRLAPEEMHRSIERWKQENPDFSYHFFSNEERRESIRAHYPKSVLAAYDALIPGAFQADLWRYCQLNRTGGVYIDADAFCVRPMRKVLAEVGDAFFVASVDHTICNVLNSFMASKPNNPILALAIERIVHTVNNRIVPLVDLEVTGPALLGNCCRQYLKKSKYYLFKEGNHQGLFLMTTKQDKLLLNNRLQYLHRFPGSRKVVVAAGANHYGQLFGEGRLYRD